MTTLQYYFVTNAELEHVIFNKYTIANGVISNKRTGITLNHHKSGKYNRCSVTDDNGKQRRIYVARAIASSILGPPPSPAHTADHKDRNPENDTDSNIQWLCKCGQNENRAMPDTYRTAFVIVRDGVEKTAKEWVDYLKDEKNAYGNNYTNNSITIYAQKKQHAFSYKEYPTLLGEMWKEIEGSKNTKGYWEISDMNRVKYVTNHAESVFSGDRLDRRGEYPNIFFNGKIWMCHVLAFMTFFPEEYANKKSDEMVLHEDDNRLDFRPHKLRLGTQSENTTDAHNNGKYDDTKSVRTKCVSYINGVLEKEHDSLADAIKFLKSNTIYLKATKSNIGSALNPNDSYNRKTAYGRTWKLVE